MAAVTHAGTTFDTAAGNKTVTATPAYGDLIVVLAATSGLAGGTTAVTDNKGGTYIQVDIDRTGFSTTGVLTAWVRESFVDQAVSTIYTAAQGGSSGGGLTVYRVSDMNNVGALAVCGSGGQSTGTSGTTPAPVLSRTPLTANVVIGAVANGSNTAALTPRASPAYTEAPTPDVGYNVPATGLDCMFINSGETSATITWGGTSPSIFASIAIELDTSNAPTYTHSGMSGVTT